MVLDNSTDITVENNFWSIDKTALNILLNRLEESNKSTLSIQNYFKQRAEIEESYGNQLLKLSETILAEEAFQVLSIASEMTARAHIDLSQNIKNLIELPLNDYVKDQDHIKLFMTNQMKESQNMKMLHIENVDRAQENYYTEAQRPNASQKNVDILDYEYQKAIKLMESKASVWIQEWVEACKTFQSIEIHRFDYLKAVIKTFASMISCASSVDEQTSERIFCEMEEVNSNQELVKFVKAYRTGSVIPGLKEYKKYQPSRRTQTIIRSKTTIKQRQQSLPDEKIIIKDIKLPVKNDEQLRSVNEQLKKIPNSCESPKEIKTNYENRPCVNDMDEIVNFSQPGEYSLNPLYSLNLKTATHSDSALHNWFNDRELKQPESINKPKSTLTTPYIQNPEWNLNQSRSSPPSPNSATKKQSTLFTSMSFLKKKKKSVTGPFHQDDYTKNKRKNLSIHNFKYADNDVSLDSSKDGSITDDDLKDSKHTPSSPLFSPIDFYYSPALDFNKNFENLPKS